MKQRLWTAGGISMGSQAAVLALGLLLSGTAVAGPHRYLALGDSFTAGTGSSRAESFPTRLVERWRKAGLSVELSNAAQNGFTTGDVIERELPELARFKPDLVSVAIGANDLVRGRAERAYRANLKIIFKAILDAGVKPSNIFVLPQPAWSESPVGQQLGDRGDTRAKIERFNAVLKEEAKAAGARYIDLWPLMIEDANKLAPDDLHPSAEVYARWAAELEKRLQLK